MCQALLPLIKPLRLSTMRIFTNLKPLLTCAKSEFSVRQGKAKTEYAALEEEGKEEGGEPQFPIFSSDSSITIIEMVTTLSDYSITTPF